MRILANAATACAATSYMFALCMVLVSGTPSSGQRAGSASAEHPQGTYAPKFTFDVASVKEAKTGDSSWINNPAHSSRFEGSRLTAEGLIITAYHASFATLHGGPDWIHTIRFSIDAKSDHSVDDDLAKLDDQNARLEKLHMLQSLLADRFNLRVHKEVTTGRIYELVRAKNPPKLQEAINPDGPPPDGIGICGLQGFSQRGRVLTAKHCSMRALANVLSMALGSTVVENTDLHDSYAFSLQWNGKNDDGPDAGENEVAQWPPLVSALREQLGLVLRPARGPVEILVIDHIDKPTPN